MPVIPNILDCKTVVSGLSASDCTYLSTIGFSGQGSNPSSGSIFVGSGGPNKFVFTNKASAGVIVVMWNDGSDPESSQAPYMNAYAPAVSYSLASGASVTMSVADAVSGGFAGVYSSSTVLSAYGQIDQTWGEFTTGADATVDVSREVNMNGNSLSIVTSNGCTSDMNDCVFQCDSGKCHESPGKMHLTNLTIGASCWECGTYKGANTGGSGCKISTFPCPSDATQTYASGGCQGWGDGTLTITFCESDMF